MLCITIAISPLVGDKQGKGGFMFDTIKITFCEFIIKDLSDWKLCADLSHNSFNPVKIRQNNEFLGSISYDLEKAFYNTDRINMTIKSLNEMNYLIVNFSIPKFLYGNNIDEFSPDHFEKLFKEINREIVMSGIFPNFESANISRLDFCSNIKTNYTFSAYKGLFNFIQSARMKKIEYDGETFYWRNKSRELKVYDKVKDVYAKDGILLDYNLMRFEKSLLKAHTHKDLKKYTDFKDETKLKSAIQNYYDDILKLFNVKELPDDTLDPWAMIEQFKEMHPRTAFKKMVEYVGILQMFKEMPEQVMNDFISETFSRSKKYENKKMIIDILKNQNLLKNIDNKAMLNEIKEKLEVSRYEKIKSI